MSTSVTERFTASLSELDVGWTHTTAEQLGDHLADVVDPPVVGAPLAYDDCQLAELLPEADLDPSLEALRAANTGVTRAAFGIADYGSVVLRTDRVPAAEAASLFVETHVAVLSASDVHPDMATAIDALAPLFRTERASAVVATGPSATADMGALVRGAHGPKDVHVLLLEDR